MKNLKTLKADVGISCDAEALTGLNKTSQTLSNFRAYAPKSSFAACFVDLLDNIMNDDDG
ncbi:unnamed protein product, partial [Ascophyllum nodosum]